MTNSPQFTGHPPMRVAPQKKSTHNKIWLAVGLALAGIVLVCTAGAIVLATAPAPTARDQITPDATKQSQSVGTPKPAAKPLAISGKGNAAAQLGATLNGGFRVDYSFGSWCGIVHFLKADGQEGAGFFETINECASDLNEKLTGSTIVHLNNVTMVKVDNTQGNWSLKFTPLG